MSQEKFEQLKKAIDGASLLTAGKVVKQIRTAYENDEITDEEREKLIEIGKEKAGGIDLSRFGVK